MSRRRTSREQAPAVIELFRAKSRVLWQGVSSALKPGSFSAGYFCAGAHPSGTEPWLRFYSDPWPLHSCAMAECRGLTIIYLCRFWQSVNKVASTEKLFQIVTRRKAKLS